MAFYIQSPLELNGWWIILKCLNPDQHPRKRYKQTKHNLENIFIKKTKTSSKCLNIMKVLLAMLELVSNGKCSEIWQILPHTDASRMHTKCLFCAQWGIRVGLFSPACLSGKKHFFSKDQSICWIFENLGSHKNSLLNAAAAHVNQWLDPHWMQAGCPPIPHPSSFKPDP